MVREFYYYINFHKKLATINQAVFKTILGNNDNVDTIEIYRRHSLKL